MKEGRKLEYKEKPPDDVCLTMPHTRGRKFQPQLRQEARLWHWGQVLPGEADVQDITPRIAPTPLPTFS